eukprot:1146063-Pelagomonas_calceolata.AAC.4
MHQAQVSLQLAVSGGRGHLQHSCLGHAHITPAPLMVCVQLRAECRCHFSLPSVEAEDDNTRGKMPPIKVKFEIPYFTVSGIQSFKTSHNPQEHHLCRMIFIMYGVGIGNPNCIGLARSLCFQVVQHNMQGMCTEYQQRGLTNGVLVGKEIVMQQGRLQELPVCGLKACVELSQPSVLQTTMPLRESPKLVVCVLKPSSTVKHGLPSYVRILLLCPLPRFRNAPTTLHVLKVLLPMVLAPMLLASAVGAALSSAFYPVMAKNASGKLSLQTRCVVLMVER